jgi:hypothetical protein
VSVPKKTTGGDDDQSRLDRELIELLQELRVILPGVQVLFAFLLTVPFSQQFAKTNTTERIVFFVAFLATTVSAVMLIVPSVWHRLQFRQRDKEDLLLASNRLTVVATVALAVAMTAVSFLIAELLYGLAAGIATAASIAVLCAVLWFLTPVARSLQRVLSGRDDA